MTMKPQGAAVEFLRSSEIIDWQHPLILRQAQLLASGTSDKLEIARRTFEWVRDEIRHSIDYQLNPVTCTASEVITFRTGFCYAKSHLLAALLRANAIPAGLCYQRLSRDGDGPPYVLHGLNAVLLPGFGWYRVDARGNKAGVNALFTPPVEQLAFLPRSADEADSFAIWPDPIPVVLHALRTHHTYQDLLENLPDSETVGRV
ncbi:MAG TPA: transglutaminase family protein [Tepidisphaeraceae bacterium]|nr:transglutaminase family protein [Tepidisphaeraceae bacterium]